MSIKRIDADLGSVSLPVAETMQGGIPVSPDRRSADGVRLRELLDRPAHERAGDIPATQAAQEGRASPDPAFGLPQRLNWLAGMLSLASLSHKDLQEGSLTLQLPPDLLKDSILELRRTPDRLAFELKIGDATARAWACDKLVALVEMLAGRIACQFTIRIVDAGSAGVVAEAGKESGDHPWHRSSFCEN